MVNELVAFVDCEAYSESADAVKDVASVIVDKQSKDIADTISLMVDDGKKDEPLTESNKEEQVN